MIAHQGQFCSRAGRLSKGALACPEAACAQQSAQTCAQAHHQEAGAPQTAAEGTGTRSGSRTAPGGGAAHPCQRGGASSAPPIQRPGSPRKQVRGPCCTLLPAMHCVYAVTHSSPRTLDPNMCSGKGCLSIMKRGVCTCLSVCAAFDCTQAGASRRSHGVCVQGACRRLGSRPGAAAHPGQLPAARQLQPGAAVAVQPLCGVLPGRDPGGA